MRNVCAQHSQNQENVVSEQGNEDAEMPKAAAQWTQNRIYMDVSEECNRIKWLKISVRMARGYTQCNTMIEEENAKKLPNSKHEQIDKTEKKKVQRIAK